MINRKKATNYRNNNNTYRLGQTITISRHVSL